MVASPTTSSAGHHDRDRRPTIVAATRPTTSAGTASADHTANTVAAAMPTTAVSGTQTSGRPGSSP